MRIHETCASPAIPGDRLTCVCDAGGMKKPTELLAPIDNNTESLMQGLIREVHTIVREDIRPVIAEIDEPNNKVHMIGSAIRMIGCAVSISDAINRLHGGGVAAPEIRQRITVERVASAPPSAIQQQGEGGSKSAKLKSSCCGPRMFGTHLSVRRAATATPPSAYPPSRPASGPFTAAGGRWRGPCLDSFPYFRK
jgi:hypothetical protein